MTDQETEQLIQQIMERAALMFIPLAASSTSHTFGEHGSMHLGWSGNQYMYTEPYQPGDPARNINHRATAKFRTLLVDKMLEDRDLTLQIVANVGSSMRFGTVRATKVVLAAELAASLINGAALSADKVSFLTYAGTKVNTHLLAAKPAKSILWPALMQMIEPTFSGEADAGMTGLTQCLHMVPSHRSIVVVIDDFLNLTNADKSALSETIARHAGTYCLLIQDPRELALPEPARLLGLPIPSLDVLVDGGSGEQRVVPLTAGNRRLYAANFAGHMADVTGFFRDQFINHAIFRTDQDTASVNQQLLIALGLE